MLRLRSSGRPTGLLVALATVAVLSCPDYTSGSDPLDLFGAPSAEPVRVWQSKPPALLPERAPGQPVDLFAATPSPSVKALEALAESRRSDVERPQVIGTLPGGVVTNYEEAYRLHVLTGKPLAVAVGQPAHVVKSMSAAARSGAEIMCVIEAGTHTCFPVVGAYRFQRSPDGMPPRSSQPVRPPPAFPHSQQGFHPGY